ncbi:MAG: hypothetical protein IT424_05460 [Pirellulales bacterium]|nr:hypothetical protein [Pirellulales bacterium]
MNAHEVFGDFPVSRFIQEYLYRLPLALQGSAASIGGWGDWETVAAALTAPDADVLIVRDGQRRPGPPPTNVEQSRLLIEEGYTLVVRRAQRHRPELAALAESFERTFRGPIDVQMFITPAGAKGFTWHYDAEDVFIIQTAGEKTYSLRKNTVNPWPLKETLPSDMRYRREIMPVLRATLRAGDLLYVPCGYWHQAEAGAGQPAASLAIGVMSRTAIDVYDALRAHLVDSLQWRQRLPLASLAATNDPLAAERREQCREMFSQLAADLSKRLTDPGLIDALVDPAKDSRP